MTTSTPTNRLDTSGSAELGVVRTTTTVLGAATLLFLLLTIGPLLDQQRYVHPVWELVAGIIVFAVPLVFAVIARRCSLRQLKIMHGSYAVAFSLVVITWIPAFIHGPMPAGMAPWTVGMTAIATVPAAIAWRRVIAWSYLIGNSLLIAPVRIIADGGVDVPLALQFAFFTITICAAFTAVVTVAIGAGREVDAATAGVREVSMRAAALTARGEEQAHLDALVHDEVIATIFAAAGAGRSDSVATRAQAARTLARLEELQQATALVPELIQPDYFIQGLATSIAETTDTADFIVTGSRSEPLPSTIASALIEASIEALRNSVAHAALDDRPVSRSVRLALSPEHVEVTVSDDGQGFELADVPANRLGIALSIIARVETLADAHAEIRSQPGDGTRVTVGWNG